ncbi:hypothetical protein MTO96_020545 [Rhipicephalus appendiculatus]
MRRRRRVWSGEPCTVCRQRCVWEAAKETDPSGAGVVPRERGFAPYLKAVPLSQSSSADTPPFQRKRGGEQTRGASQDGGTRREFAKGKYWRERRKGRDHADEPSPSLSLRGTSHKGLRHSSLAREPQSAPQCGPESDSEEDEATHTRQESSPGPGLLVADGTARGDESRPERCLCVLAPAGHALERVKEEGRGKTKGKNKSAAAAILFSLLVEGCPPPRHASGTRAADVVTKHRSQMCAQKWPSGLCVVDYPNFGLLRSSTNPSSHRSFRRV